MTAKAKPNLFFRKKVYASIYSPAAREETVSESIKKIVPSSKMGGLREDFKKVFLPLLIDVFELRKQVQNYKREPKLPFMMGGESTCPKEILQKLTDLQSAIEESRRWCEGVILQIEKGIGEAKEALQFIEKMGDKSGGPEKNSFKSKLCKLFSKK